jgi:hypothetical protein
MSDETRRAVEDAIRAHVSDGYDEPRVVTDWVVLSANQGLNDDSNGYCFVTPMGMSAHVLTGLVAHFLDNFRADHVRQAQDDDEEPR